MRKKLLLSAVALTMMGSIGLTAAPQAVAQKPNGDNTFQSLLQMIEQKFGLDHTQVQSVVNDYKSKQKTTMQQNMQKRETDRLDKLVKDGKITASQKQAILDELAKIRTEYPADSFKNMTADERKAAFQKEQEELNAWAKSQNIDPKYLMPGFDRGMGKSKRDMRWANHTTSPTPVK